MTEAVLQKKLAHSDLKLYMYIFFFFFFCSEFCHTLE